MNTSAAIADRCSDEPTAGELAPRTLDILHEYASGSLVSARKTPPPHQLAAVP